MGAMSWQGHGWGGGRWIGIVWVALWAALLIGAVWMLRRAAAGADSGAEGLLAARYARGEISEDEYRERLDVLREMA